MTRFVIDPPTLVLHAEDGRAIDPAHQLVAPNSELEIRVLGDRVSRRVAWRTAREHSWTTIRDAEYLAIAKLQADALIATDPELAARASGLVPLAAVSELYT